MGLYEVKMTPEEKDAYIASRITDLADSIINIKNTSIPFVTRRMQFNVAFRADSV